MAPDEPKAKKAVALLYDRATGAAPKVVASGANLTAERIIAAAREAGVHITEDADLVELLARIPVGAPIPAELYQTVAELLACVYAVNQRFKEKLGPMDRH